MLALGEQRDLVIHVFQDDEYGGLASELLSTVVLRNRGQIRGLLNVAKTKMRIQLVLDNEIYLHSYGEIVLLNSLVIKRMVDLDVSISPSVLLFLLYVERVILIGLIG